MLPVALSGCKGKQVGDPVFSPGGGSFDLAQTVTISCATADAAIRYTNDGSTPTSSHGILYKDPITVSSSTTLKAIAYKIKMKDSAVVSSSYAIANADASITVNDGTNPLGGATVSITVDGINKTATTDASGVAIIAGLPLGTHNVTASASGYQNKSITIDVTASGGSGTISLTGAGGEVLIEVRELDNSPIPQATITVTVNGSVRTQLTSTTGTASFANLPTGDFVFMISKEGFTSQSVTITVTTTPAAYQYSLQYPTVLTIVSFLDNNSFKYTVWKSDRSCSYATGTLFQEGTTTVSIKPGTAIFVAIESASMGNFDTTVVTMNSNHHLEVFYAFPNKYRWNP